MIFLNETVITEGNYSAQKLEARMGNLEVGWLELIAYQKCWWPI